MIVVTGGAGFIGSCLIAQLNQRGVKDIVVVDRWDADGQKKLNLEGKVYQKFYDKCDFLQLILSDAIKDPVTAIFHMGACSSTTGQDPEYYRRNNFEYSCHIARWSLRKGARLIYASSAATYGDGQDGYSDTPELIRKCKPLNYYGQSKQKFDEWVLDNQLYDKVAGLKFFNVFGPNEYHKGDMKSVIAKAYDKVASEGLMVLFKSHRQDYADGQQMRDFIYVKDVVDVMMHFLDNPSVNGIFNLGTGRARTWNDLARALFVAANKPVNIEYIPMPEILKDKYQYFTEADMSRLRKAGYTKPFTSLEEAVVDYVGYLKKHTYM
ncbi:MAG: ADP-glyceromanno-heptose 6-epimerase [Candidatus Omnitrophica bacterium]|nr:ADP-glyceromanno-heptose 6-epimerase [Candidatus Omnitrophota bacterium]